MPVPACTASVLMSNEFLPFEDISVGDLAPLELEDARSVAASEADDDAGVVSADASARTLCRPCHLCPSGRTATRRGP